MPEVCPCGVTVAGLSLAPTAWSEVCRAGVALSTIPSSGADPIVDLLEDVVLGSESVSLRKLMMSTVSLFGVVIPKYLFLP